MNKSDNEIKARIYMIVEMRKNLIMAEEKINERITAVLNNKNSFEELRKNTLRLLDHQMSEVREVLKDYGLAIAYTQDQIKEELYK